MFSSSSERNRILQPLSILFLIMQTGFCEIFSFSTATRNTKERNFPAIESARKPFSFVGGIDEHFQDFLLGDAGYLAVSESFPAHFKSGSWL